MERELYLLREAPLSDEQQFILGDHEEDSEEKREIKNKPGHQSTVTSV